MSKEKIEMKTNGTYTFTSNALWHWKEQFRREPRMVISVIALSIIAVGLPLLNARLPKQVLCGLEEHIELKQLVLQVGILILIFSYNNFFNTCINNHSFT